MRIGNLCDYDFEVLYFDLLLYLGLVMECFRDWFGFYFYF